MEPVKWTIAVKNGDDAPIQFRTVRLVMRERRLCFDEAGGTSYSLFYGDVARAAPQYDYATLFVAEANAAMAKLGNEQANPTYIGRPDARPFRKMHPALLWIALVGAVAVLGAIALEARDSGEPKPK